MRITAWQLLAGVALDWALGDPPWLPHPVRGLGRLAAFAERAWRATSLPPRIAGVFFWFTVVGSAVGIVWLTLPWAAVYWVYSLLACRDLDVEAGRVVRALGLGDLSEAREKLSRIVGRDTHNLGEPEILRATVETVAENMSDGVIAPLFYLALAGPAGMAAYKAVNTLDSIAGHRNERYRDFGWMSARMDDLANLAPARLTSLLIWISALLPGFHAFQSARVTWRDGASQPSPNAGYPEAAVAGALGIQLGGVNFYGGVASVKPFLGDAHAPVRRGDFARVRVLLYTGEALFVAAILGYIRWR